ncbi:hypothetical protein G6F42_024402 [Rhizopus arrhizus]|nr:hypothetical protein G6F42_024402 [Rhizopus arrhizus]
MILALKQSHRLELLWLVAVAVFPLHLYWYYGILTQLIRKYSANVKLALFTPNPITANVASPDAINSKKKRRPKHAFLDRIYTF